MDVPGAKNQRAAGSMLRFGERNETTALPQEATRGMRKAEGREKPPLSAVAFRHHAACNCLRKGTQRISTRLLNTAATRCSQRR